jgi:hypothetical protein
MRAVPYGRATRGAGGSGRGADVTARLGGRLVGAYRAKLAALLITRARTFWQGVECLDLAGYLDLNRTPAIAFGPLYRLADLVARVDLSTRPAHRQLLYESTLPRCSGRPGTAFARSK